jgi:hypothetical protein
VFLPDTPAMRRIGLRLGVAGLGALLAVSLAAPAQARWGEGRVDTWLSRGSSQVGVRLVAADTPALSLHVRPGITKSLFWVIKNKGGQPSTHYVFFTGCASANGVGVAYATVAGNRVTYRVAHDGYRSRRTLLKGDRTALRIRVTGRAEPGVWRCRLKATGLSGRDSVVLKVSNLG